MMTFTDTIEFIKEAHAGQLYGDQPYWTHPVAVALMLCKTHADATEDENMAALLHDVIEDTKWTEEMLRPIFGDAVIDMVVLLSKDETMDYRANIQRIIDSGNVGAMRVKLADNNVNISGDKSHMSAGRREKLMTRYQMSIEMLGEALANV